MKNNRSFHMITKALASNSEQITTPSSAETSRSLPQVEEMRSSFAANASYAENECHKSNLILNDTTDPTNNSLLKSTPITQADSKQSNSSSSSSSSCDTTSSSGDFDSDDSLFDKDYVPPQKKNLKIASESDSDGDIIENSNQRNICVSESSESVSEDQLPAQSNRLTKKGTLRKRTHYETKLEERKTIKKELKNNIKYCLKPGCNESCKKKCNTKISLNHRAMLNKTFRKFSNKEQYIYIANNTSQSSPARRTQRKNNNSKNIYRGKTIKYFLNNETGEKFNVCKTYFLTTLGFKKNNDKVVRSALKHLRNDEIRDRRGLNPNPRKIDNRLIIDHINSFHPAISHYRREHAPNRKYLPSDLNVRDMHKDFCEKHNCSPENCVSYDHYRRVLKDLNISFAKLGSEECETCEIYKIHNTNFEIRHRNCAECKQYEIHHKRYVLARDKYNEDKKYQMKNNNENSDTMFYSVDLEKVIMLPRLEEFKVVMFCPRIILFNESFVPLGDKKLSGSRQTYACIWHEAISGRKKDDIASCFKAFFTYYRDLKHITLWMDNCAAQNKNWSLLSYLVYLINSNDVNLETVTLKYLEVGHTFMSADEFHHQVELSLKRKKRIYDFDDFRQAVTDTQRNITVKCMNVCDFNTFEDCSSTYKLHNVTPRAYLNKMCEIKFHRGHNTLVYKTDFDGTETKLDFLRMKNLKIGIPSPKPNNQPKGITEERKSEIINKLVPLMPENRRTFWYNLPSNSSSVNLIDQYEE